jgi:hypothetical protein
MKISLSFSVEAARVLVNAAMQAKISADRASIPEVNMIEQYY